MNQTEPRTVPAVFINCRRHPFVEQILSRRKPFETRTRNTLRRFLGERILLAETGRGAPLVRGSAVVTEIIEVYTRSAWDTPGIPKMTFVAEADDYVTPDGKEIKKEQIDLLSHMMSMQKTHPSYAMTGAMCTAAAAVVPGSIVNQVLPADVDTQFIRIGHPAGILECGVDYREHGAVPVIDDTFGFRTANLLMEGVAVIRG